MYQERVDAAAAQQRWEYCCEAINLPEQLENILNAAGQQRWELVHILVEGATPVAVFKRPCTLYASRLTMRTKPR